MEHKAVPSEDRNFDDMAEVFALLGDPSRLRLLFALRDGERRVGELARIVGASESSVSHALRLLRAHRVVEVRRVGRLAFYRLSDGHVRTLLEVADAHLQHSVLVHPERPGPA